MPSKKRFNQQIAAVLADHRSKLIARLSRLDAAARGEAEIREVEVKSHWVKRHQRGPYTRVVVVLPRPVGKRKRR